MSDPQGGLRRRRFRRALLIGLPLVVAAVGVLVVLLRPVPRLDAWARARLRSELTRAFGRPVSVGAVWIFPLRLSFEARDIVIGERPPGTARVLEIPRLSGTLERSSIWRGLRIADLRIENPRVFLFRRGARWEGPIPLEPEGTAPAGSPSVVRPRPLVRRLEVEGGTLSVEDKSAPFWFVAEDVAIGWDGDEQGDGKGTVTTARFAGGGGGATLGAGRLRLEAALEGMDLTGRATAEWGASSVRIEGAVSLPRRNEQGSGSARISWHLEETPEAPFLATLLHLEHPAAGILDGSGSLRFARGRWSGEGRLQGKDLLYADLAAKSLVTDVKAADSAIELENAKLETFGGSLAGSARIEPRAGGALHASFQGDRLSVNPMLRVLGLRSPLEGLSSAQGTFDARLGELSSLQGRVSVRVLQPPASPRPGEGRVGVSGNGEVLIEARRVTFRGQDVHAGGTLASLEVEKVLGQPETRLHIAAECASLAEGSSLLQGFLDLQPEPVTLPWDGALLEGRGSLDASVEFSSVRPVRGAASFSFADFAYESIGAKSLSGSGEAMGDAFLLHVSRGEKDGGTLTLEGSFPEGHAGPSRVTGAFTGWPIDDVLARAGASPGAAARATGGAEYRFGSGPATGNVDLALAGVALADLSFTEGRLQAALEGSRFDVAQLRLDGPRAALSASGSYDLESRDLSGTLEAVHIDAAMASSWLRGLPLTGHAAISLRGEVSGARTEWTARVTPEADFSFAGRSLTSIAVSVNGDASRARFEGALGEMARFSGSLALQAPHEGEGRIELRNVPIGALASLARPDLALQVGGELGGDVTWSGPLDEPRGIRAQASLQLLRLALGAESFEPTTPARISLQDGVVRFDDVDLAAASGHLKLQGTYPLQDGPPVDLRLEGQLDLGALGAFVPDLAAAGSLRLTLRAEGPRSDPALGGSIEVDDGRLRLIDFPLLADRIQLRAQIGPGSITAQSISAVLGGGELSGKGRIDLEGLRPTGFRIEGRVTSASLAMPEGFRGQYSGRLVWEGKEGEPPALTGDLELLRGIWERDFQLDQVSLGEHVREPVFQVAAPDEGLQSMRLNFTIHADDNVRCRNDLADVEGRADLQVRGTVGRPLVMGSFEAFEGGEMRFRGVRYQVDQARVEFPPGPVFNPRYEIDAETNVQSYDVHLHLSGNLDRLDFDLTSNPPLTQNQLLTLLVTGSLGEEEGTSPSPGSSEPAFLVTGQIGSIVGQRLERWLGFEEIRIEPALLPGSADPTTRVTLGKRLSPRIFVKTSVALNSPEAPIYQVEYLLNRKIRLALERGELGALGGGLRYSTRFFSPGAKDVVRDSGTVPSRRSKTVSEIVFTGDTDENPTLLRRIARLRKGQAFSRRNLVEGTDRLKRYYVRNSYLEASVRGSAKDLEERQVGILYAITRGPRVTIALEGAGVYRRRISNALKLLWEESTFGGDLVGEAEDRIERLLQEEGFYACYVRTAVVQTPREKRVTFQIDPGEKVVVQSVTITGAQGVPEADIRRQVLTGEETLFRRSVLKPETLASDIAAIENLYRSRGFLEARARSSVALSADGRRAVVTIALAEGPPSRLRKVEIVGNAAIPAERLRPLVLSRTGEPFRPVRVVSDREGLQRLYDAEGYPEATVEEGIEREGEDVDLTYRITEGARKTVREVRIEGNALTNDAVIRREVPFQPGDVISVEKIQETRKRLIKTGLFSDVQVSYEDPPGQNAGQKAGQILYVRVREAENLILGLGVGYDTESGPRGSLELVNTNLWGRGESLGFSGIYGSKLERAQVNFKEPRLFPGPWGTILSWFYEKRQRESFGQRQVGSSILLERHTRGPVAHYLRYSASISEVFDLLVPESTFQEENFRIPLGRIRLASLGYDIVRDTRNDPILPSRGTYASADVRVFGRALGSEKTFSKLFLQGTSFQPLPLDLTWVSSVRVGLAWRGMDEPIPLQERFFAGGGTTVRGFGQDRLGFVEVETIRQDRDNDGTVETEVVDLGTIEHETLRPLGGEALLIVNNELRHRIYKTLSATAFVDAGNVYPRPGEIRNGHFRYTAGLGVRLETPVGPLRLEYGRKLDREKGESPGEFVLSIGQSF